MTKDPLAEANATIAALQAQVKKLTERISELEPSEPAASGVRFKAGFFPEIVDGLSVLDTDQIEAEDKLAYATGYVTGKLGQAPDPIVLCVPDDAGDYQRGYDLGRLVHGGAARPTWDRTPLKN